VAVCHHEKNRAEREPATEQSKLKLYGAVAAADGKLRKRGGCSRKATARSGGIRLRPTRRPLQSPPHTATTAHRINSAKGTRIQRAGNSGYANGRGKTGLQREKSEQENIKYDSVGEAENP